MTVVFNEGTVVCTDKTGYFSATPFSNVLPFPSASKSASIARKWLLTSTSFRSVLTARLRLPVVKRNGRGLTTPSGDLLFILPTFTTCGKVGFVLTTPSGDLPLYPPHLYNFCKGGICLSTLTLSIFLPYQEGSPGPAIALSALSLYYRPPWPTIPADYKRIPADPGPAVSDEHGVFSLLAEFVSEIQSGPEI